MADVSKATQMNNGLAIQVYNEQSCLLMEKRMRTAYQSAIDELQKELDDFYEKYATNNKIDLQVAKQKLSLSDSENVKDLAEQYKQLLSKKNIGVRTQKKLDEIAAKTKVSRLEQLLVNCTKQAAEVGMKAKDEMIDVGSLMYKDGFGHTMFNIQKTVGMGVNFNMPSARVIKTASNVEWLGATFTDRTGYTLDRLTNNIEQIIPQLFIQGKNADEFGKAIAKQFNMSENAAKRDMRTLTTLITNQASILAYNNCEMVEEFEFVATLDGRTSDKCRAMDGKRFKLNEAAPFINQPPLHYNCRSTTIPYFEDLDKYNPSERIARDEQGKTYMVPANMSYREWCTKHAQGLYANSDKIDWNYEPEKVLAYERIVDERRKLKALQEDRVVYQDSDFVVGHDISNYSEEEIENLMVLFNVKQNKKEQLQQKINETMTRINNIRKELNSDKTANILPAEDYNDIIGNLHKYYEMLNDEYDILNEKSSYQKYVKVMGLNDKPETMSRKDFESYTKKNKDLPVFYRAVTDAGPTGTAGGITRGKYLRCGILNDLMYGSQQYIGDGIYGDGLYFSTQPTHQSYGGFIGSANEAIDRKYMIKATFKSGTKKILYDDLEKMINEYKEKGYNITDPSSFARSLGYHVIQAHKDGEREIYYNIIDRSCLVVQDVDKESVELSPEEQKRRIILTNKASIRDMFSNSDELNMRNMQFSVKQQNSNLFSYNEIVAFDVAVNNEELATLIKFAFKDKLYSDELKEHLKIKKFDDEYNNVIDSIKKLATDDDIVVDYFDKKIKIKKQELYDKIMESFDDKASNEKAARSKSADAAKQVIEFIKNSLNSGTSFDDLVKLNNQLSVNMMANKLSSALDTIVDSAYSNVEDYIGISAKKELNVKQTKQKISDNVKQQMPTYDKTTVNNIKKAVNNGKSNDDAMRFIVDRMLLDDDVFSDLNILSNFENYIKEAVNDDDVYENAFNRTYDELYRKMDKLLDTDVPHEFVLYKRKDGTKVQTDLIFSDLEDWLFEMKKVKDSDVVAKSFVLEKIRYQIYNEYVNDFSRRFIGELKESEYDDVDKLVKSYNNKFIKRSQELIEQAAPKKASKGVKVGPHILNDEEIKALERKDTYDFNELRRKAVKEFKYYKGTMKKAEIQNESLKQSEKISKNNEKYFHQTMLDIFEKNDFCMRLNKNVLPLIAQSKFMNQFETGSAPLGLTFNQRRVVAKKMFTIPEDAEGSEYEKYGFLGSKNPKDDFKDDESFTGDYGDSIVRFKKRNLMHRTTFTIGDSLFNCMHDDVRSSPVINPQIASIQRGHVNEVIYGLNVVENANAEKSYLDIQALTRQKYIELQYHGNLTIDDVESVTFNAKNTNPNNPEVRKIIAMLKERGIKCYLSNSKSEVIEEL